MDTRDSRGFESETKFVVDRSTGDRIRDWARAQLEPDPHGDGPFGDQYRITSLYFDTADFDVFHRRGSYDRSKYRIRRYDGHNVGFLERKLRRDGRHLSKRRTAVPLHDLKHLANGDVPWAGRWFQQRLALRRLIPVCQVSYERVARVGDAPSGRIRLTVDDDIRALARSDVGFDPSVTPVLPHMMIVEMKCGRTPPAVFTQLVESFTLTPSRLSKYRLTVSALGLIPEDTAACGLQPVDADGAQL